MSNPILTLGNHDDLADLSLYLRHILQLDPSAIVRLEQYDNRVLIWSDPGFKSLTVRGVAGTIEGKDVVVGADSLLTGLIHAQKTNSLSADVGFRMDSSWNSGNPPLTGYEHIEDIDANDVVRLARQGQVTAQQNPGPLGVSASLLNQDVITIASPHGDIGIQLRSIFTLLSCGFIRVDGNHHPIDDDKVRVRVSGDWVRLDARYGSVAQRFTPQPPQATATGNLPTV